jgi:hypothetical protein
MSIEQDKALVCPVIEGRCTTQGNITVIDERFSPDYVHHSLPPGMPHDREG